MSYTKREREVGTTVSSPFFTAVRCYLPYKLVSQLPTFIIPVKNFEISHLPTAGRTICRKVLKTVSVSERRGDNFPCDYERTKNIHFYFRLMYFKILSVKF